MPLSFVRLAATSLFAGACSAQFYAPVTLAQNQGNGSPTGYFEIVDMDAADLDNDGDTDFVFAVVGSNPIFWLRNNGNGSYSLLQISNPSFLNGVSAVHAADMDGDGDVDILFGAGGGYGGPVIPGSNSQLRIYRNNGAGSFTGTNIFSAGSFGSFSLGAKGVNQLTSADMDGDGDLDIVMCQGVDAAFGVNWDRVVWIDNDGTANFGATRTVDPGSAGDVPRRADAADVDGDGDVDLVVAYAGSDELVCWKNPGAGTGSWTFTVLRSNALSWDAQFGDVDGDGKLDVVATHGSGEVACYAGDGAGGFASQQVIGTAGPDAGPVALTDVDGDGDLDVFAGPREGVPGVTGDLLFFDGQGAGTFAAAQSVQGGTTTTGIRFADLTGDGQRDLIVADDVGLRLYELNFSPNAAQKATFGASCPSAASAIYEQLPQQSMDLAGKAITGTRTPAGHDVSVGPSTIEPLGPNAVLLDLDNDQFLTNLARPVSLGGVGASFPIGVSANGFVTLNAPFPPLPSSQPPYQVTELLGIGDSGFSTDPVPTLFAWTDLAPSSAAGGGVFTTQLDLESGTLGSFISGVPWPQLLPTSDPLQAPYFGQPQQDVLYGAFGQYSLHGALTLPHASGTAPYVVTVRYQSNTGAELKLEEAGGGAGSLYQQLVLPAGPAWQTATFSVNLPAAINPALAFDAASNGPARINWIRISEPPPSTGGVYYEQLDATTARVTFDGVAGNGAAGANTVQFTLEVAGVGSALVSLEDFTIAFGSVSPNNPAPWLVGFTAEGLSADLGPRDLSAGPYTIGDEDVLIDLDSSYPRLGSPWVVTLSGYGPQPVGFLFIGDTRTDPGIPLAVLGAPGCSAYTNANLAAQVLFMFNGASATSIPIPNNASVIGVELACQATAVSTLNVFGLATSNGLYARVGN